MTRHLSAAFAAAAMLAGTAPIAVAQSFWSTMPELNSLEDKVRVHFPRTYQPGDIVVSFADRRLLARDNQSETPATIRMRRFARVS